MAIRRKTRSAEQEFIETMRESLDNAERLLREAAESSGDKATELRERAMHALERTRDGLHGAQDELLEHSRRAARATDDYIHDNPWQAVAVAGLAGLVIGALMCRR
ncbi:MAG TPA: DUF883 family protein [Burkholderiaceae bacterium]|nr:DUF883 family protein [Burkholderiaceae bacterium]